MSIPIIGGGDSGPGQMKLNINPNDLKPCVCKRCGCPFFQMAFAMGELPGVLIGSPNNQYVPVAEFLICARCGWELGKEIPIDGENSEENISNTEEPRNPETPDNLVVIGEEELVDEETYKLENVIQFGKTNSSTEE